jgi:hypothetical protein
MSIRDEALAAWHEQNEMIAKAQQERQEALRQLSENVDKVFAALSEAETAYLFALEAQHNAKETLARAIDMAYDDGDVVGKNEREREAHLRRLLPSEYNEAARRDALVRGAERVFREAQRDVERLTLQIRIMRMAQELGLQDQRVVIK